MIPASPLVETSIKHGPLAFLYALGAASLFSTEFLLDIFLCHPSCKEAWQKEAWPCQWHSC
jgi:hypothetical protein